MQSNCLLDLGMDLLVGNMVKYFLRKKTTTLTEILISTEGLPPSFKEKTTTLTEILISTVGLPPPFKEKNNNSY